MRVNTYGFSLVEVLLVIAVLVLIGVTAWMFMAVDETEEPATDEAAIESSEDLESAEQELSETDLDSELDTSEFDEVLNES